MFFCDKLGPSIDVARDTKSEDEILSHAEFNYWAEKKEDIYDGARDAAKHRELVQAWKVTNCCHRRDNKLN